MARGGMPRSRCLRHRGGMAVYLERSCADSGHVWWCVVSLSVVSLPGEWLVLVGFGFGLTLGCRRGWRCWFGFRCWCGCGCGCVEFDGVTHCGFSCCSLESSRSAALLQSASAALHQRPSKCRQWQSLWCRAFRASARAAMTRVLMASTGVGALEVSSSVGWCMAVFGWVMCCPPRYV